MVTFDLNGGNYNGDENNIDVVYNGGLLITNLKLKEDAKSINDMYQWIIVNNIKS